MPGPARRADGLLQHLCGDTLAVQAMRSALRVNAVEETATILHRLKNRVRGTVSAPVA